MQRMIVAICDDDPLFLEGIENLMMQVAFHLDVRIKVHLFSSGEALIQKINEDFEPSVVFLDVEIPDIDGLSLGHLLRKKLGKEVPLVVMSYLRDYALNAYQVQAMDFLLKPISRLTLQRALERARQKLNRGPAFRYVHKGIAYEVPITKIYYFESDLRHIKIHTEDIVRSFRGTLKNVEKDVALNDFVRPHQSFLVNEKYVKRRTYEALILENNDIIPISQNRRSMIRAHFLKTIQDTSRGDQPC